MIGLLSRNLLFVFALYFFVSWSTLEALAGINYTKEELAALEKFRPIANQIVKHDYQKIDGYLIRWLRARDLKVEPAAEMLRRAEKWRKDINIEAPVPGNIPGIPNDLYTADGVDNEGRIVFTTSVGNVDFRRLIISGNRDKYLSLDRHETDKVIRAAAERVIKSNGTIADSRVVSIFDLNGFSLTKHACLSCIELQIAIRREGENYFPGNSAVTVFINTPRIAKPLTDILLAITSGQASSGLKIFGTDRKEWAEYLLKHIPADQLTYQFGGTKKIEGN